MNDNYLWDKSGEPDEEIQQLESLLSEFRYDPRPLVLPAETPKRTIFDLVPLMTWRYAALAAMALLALGLGIWLSVRLTTNAPTVVANPATPTPTATPEQIIVPVPHVAPPAPAPQTVKQPYAPAPKAHFVKHHAPRKLRKSLDEEGERAKEKVLYALQITSEKLNLISKKIQTDTN